MNSFLINTRCWMLSIVVCVISFFGHAQNLVPNPGFEESSICPGGYSEAAHEFRVNSWCSATRGTPDHFHSCSSGEADVPHNWAGVSEAYEGKGYVGIYLWTNGKQYREYLQCRLLSPLLKDSVYSIEFHYKLSSYSKYAIDRIGLIFTDSVINLRHDKVLTMIPTLSVIQDSALTKSTGLWEVASMKYKAKGGEQLLTIGNFFGDDVTRSYKIQFRPISQEMLAYSAYYYIDDVKVIPNYVPQLLALAELVPEFSDKETRLNTTYVLKNIQFELNSYRLVPPSFGELDNVAEYLVNHPTTNVQLFGHTDDQGNEPYNLKLSTDRAKNVGAYLTSAGVSSKRIEVFGYGETKPLIDSITEEARAINRRVEVKFVE